MRRAAVATWLVLVAGAAAGLALWEPSHQGALPTSLPAPGHDGLVTLPSGNSDEVAKYLARVTEEMPFRATRVESLDPSWESAETLATGTLETAQFDGVGAFRIASLGSQRKLILKDYDITYAPGVRVMLGVGPRARRVAELGGPIVGELKSAAGTQSFDLPASLNLDGIRSVALVSTNEGVVVVSGDLVFRR